MLPSRQFAFSFACRRHNGPVNSLFRFKDPVSLPLGCCRLFSSPTKTAEERVPIKFLYLNNLYDNPGAVKKYRRVGRGIGSSKGKTCGRGHKGQKARSGVIPAWFEGGQTPLHIRLPKRGFKSKLKPLVPLNVGRLQDYVEMGRLPGVGDSELNPINMYDLIKTGMIKANTTCKHFGVKLLADGKERLTTPLHVLISRASIEAIKAVEDAGGTVTTFHYNERALRQLLRGKVKDRRSRPPPRLHPYYTSWTKRGFLHPWMQLRKWFQKSSEHLQTKFQELRKQLEDERSKTEDTIA